MALNRAMTSRAGDSSGCSAWNLILMYPSSAALTSASASVVRSIVKQFLHQVAHMSMRTGLPSRSAAARPSSSDEYQPSSSMASTLDVTSDASTQRSANSV